MCPFIGKLVVPLGRIAAKLLMSFGFGVSSAIGPRNSPSAMPTSQEYPKWLVAYTQSEMAPSKYAPATTCADAVVDGRKPLDQLVTGINFFNCTVSTARTARPFSPDPLPCPS